MEHSTARPTSSSGQIEGTTPGLRIEQVVEGTNQSPGLFVWLKHAKKVIHYIHYYVSMSGLF